MRINWLMLIKFGEDVKTHLSACDNDYLPKRQLLKEYTNHCSSVCSNQKYACMHACMCEKF